MQILMRVIKLYLWSSMVPWDATVRRLFEFIVAVVDSYFVVVLESLDTKKQWIRTTTMY